MKKNPIDLFTDNSLHLVGCALFGLVILALPFALLVYYLGPVLADLLAGELGAAVVITMVATPVIWIVSRQIAAVLVARADARKPQIHYPPPAAIELHNHRGFNPGEVEAMRKSLTAPQQAPQLPSGPRAPWDIPIELEATSRPGQAGASGGIGWKR